MFRDTMLPWHASLHIDTTTIMCTTHHPITPGVVRSTLNPCLAPGRQKAVRQLLEDLGHAQQPLCFHARLLVNGYMLWALE